MKLKSMIIRLIVVLTVIFSTVSGPQDALAQTPDTHVFIDPDSSIATTCGTHTIAIGVEEVVDLTAFELMIDFDPTVVAITTVENGGFLVEPGEDAFYSPDNNDGEWNSDGYIIFGMAQQGDGTGDPTPKTGSGDLIHITMDVLVPNATVDFEIDPAESMLVDWPDAFEIPFTITNGVVNTAYCAPTDITLSNDTVLEKQPIGTEVGVFTTIDPDPGDTSFTYSLVDGLSYPDNAAFSIAGDKLLTSEIFDYDTKNSYTIKVRSTDPWGEYYEKVFTINVTWVPIATADQYPIKENGSLVLDPPGVLSNDYAPSGKSLTAELVEGLSPGEGTLVFNSDGSLVYVPPEDWTGIVTFSYRACVGDLCSEPVTVTLEVRTVPEAVDDSYATYVNETLAVEALGILENDVLGEDLTLTAELLTDIPSGEGSLTLLADGSFDYSPPMDWTGTTSFTYRACDTVFCSGAATVTINVVEVPIAVDDSYATSRDELLAVAVPGVLGNDVAPGGVTLTAEIETDIPIGEGSLVLGSNGSLLYVPPTGWIGSTSFTYRACYDSICSAPATVTIEVKEIPVALPDSYEIPEDGSLIEPAPGVLGNDIGPAGETLIAVLVSDVPSGEGALVLNPDGSFTYTPPVGWTGITSFTYQACYDGICSDPVSVTLEVKQVPVAAADNYELPQNSSLSVSAPGVLENDTPESASLTAVLEDDIPTGEGTLVFNSDGSFSYTPPIDWTGTTSFTYRACDGEICSEPATVSIDVKETSVVNDDDFWTFINDILTVAAPGVLENDQAPNGGLLTATLVDDIPAVEGTLNLNEDGSFDYTPPDDWIGTTSFTYRACYDSICSEIANVTIHVLETECLVVDPDILEQTLPPDSSGPLTLSLTNTCSYDVDFNLVERSPSIHEGFEDGDMPPSGGWQTEHLGDTPFEWTIKDAQINPDYVDEGRYAAWMTYHKVEESNEWLRSPILDPSTLTDLSLSFRAYSSTDYPGATMKLWVTNAAGEKITTFSTEPLWDMVRDESWESVEYRSIFLDLSDFAGYSEPIRIAWQYVGKNGQSFGLDMIDIGIFSDVPWLTMSPTAGTVPAGETQEVTVNFDSTGLETGDYFAAIDVENTPYPMIPVPVIFHVESEGYYYYLPLITH